jgi:hypothetical protein
MPVDRDGLLCRFTQLCPGSLAQMSESAPLPGNELGYRRDGLLRYSYDCSGRWEASAAHRVWVEGIRALTDLIFFPLLYWFDRIFFDTVNATRGGGETPH